MPKKLVILTIVAVVLISVGGAAAYFATKSQKGAEQGMREEQTVATLPEPTPSEVDTSDWKTYRNEEYGFELRYPSGWILLDMNPSTIYIISDLAYRVEEGNKARCSSRDLCSPDLPSLGVTIEIKDNSSLLPLKQWVFQEFDLAEPSLIYEIEISEVKALRLKEEFSISDPVDIFIANDPYIYHIWSAFEDSEELKQVLSSLKLLPTTIRNGGV